MLAKLLTLLMICLAGIYAAQDYGECPLCTDPYNPASCTGRQTCHEQACELRVDRGDRNRIQYNCAHGHSCASHEAHGCSSRQEHCSYCCLSYDACLQQLGDLFPVSDNNSTTSTSELLTPSASIDFSATPAQSEDLTATSAIISNIFATSATLEAPPSAVISSILVSATASEAVPSSSAFFTFSTTATPATPVTAPARQSCVQCGDFASDKPCTPIESHLNVASSCPEGLPYCFETVSINGDNLQVIRGCAEANFCRVEWDIGHSRPGCYPLDVTTANVTCTYCCSGNSCNNITPPSAESQVTYP